jgi:formylglycine-generating enzyme required for sulfatase activity
MRASLIPSLLTALCVVMLTASGGQGIARAQAQLTVKQEANQIILSWDSVPGRPYQVFQSTGLDQPWEKATIQPLMADGNRLSYVAPIGDGVRVYRVATQSLETATDMIWIPSGTFTMGTSTGDPDSEVDEEPRREVTISSGFWMGKYPVTQAEYEAITGINPSFFNGVRHMLAPNTDYGYEPTRPVESVSWEDAVAYCVALTNQERAAGRIEENMRYRLPTEAEREYAARAGTNTRFSYGDDLDYSQLKDYAWFLDNSDFRTHPVGQKLPNPWGFYDMYGNVWEWCLDWYGPYTSGPVTDPQGPKTGENRVLRGGTFANVASWCRSSNRDVPRGEPYDFGFRVVLGTDAP